MHLAISLLVLLFCAGGVLFLFAMLVVDMWGRFDLLHTKFPRLAAVSENRKVHGLLLLICVGLLIGDGYELVDKEIPEAELPPIIFAAPAVPTINKVVQLVSKESPTSLRRRTVKLADELVQFWIDHPAPLQQPLQNPTTDEERARNAKWDKYWREVESLYAQDYKDRVLGIVREYKVKGVPTGWLEQSAENHPFGGSPFTQRGSAVCFNDEICQFRELAFHVDAHDQVINPNF